jgi:beta-mannanase
MWYQDWSEPLYYSSQVRATRAIGATPIISWDPARGGAGLRFADIAAGRYDRYIARNARRAASSRGRLVIRYAYEMNLTSVPWGSDRDGNAPSDYRRAWRHVVRMFRDRGADNVEWIWAPNIDYGRRPFKQFYPGDRWVDYVGLDGYNFGPAFGDPWMSLGRLFLKSYRRLVSMSSRPVIITETASSETGGDKATWIRRGLLHDIPTRLPKVRAVIWFDTVQETDWRIDSSFAAANAFRAAATSRAYRARNLRQAVAAGR